MSEVKCCKNLCYFVNDKNEILLQLKRRGFGRGKWNGPGGKQKADETIEQSAVREAREETGLTMIEFKQLAELEFIYENHGDWDNITYVYLCRNFSGDLKESDEGELKWFRFEDIPYQQMWGDDPYWLPKVLSGESVRIRFYFDQDGKLLKYFPR